MSWTGYGVDQMYLWYKRDGAVLDHDVLVFAFVTDDFLRLQFASVGGYGKPVLKLRSGQLVVDNVPVPRRSRFVHWLALKPNPLRQFRSVAALASLAGWVLPARESSLGNGPTGEQRQVVDKMIEALQAIEEQKNSILVLVYLPTRGYDYEQSIPSLAWRAFIRSECRKRGVVFFDLLDDFQKLPLTMKDGMFIWPGSVQYFVEAPGHYDDQGHDYVAKQLYARLLSIPQVVEKLGRQTEGQVAKQVVGSAPRSAESHVLPK